MSRSSGRRAQVEPLAALVAVFAVGIGLALYATSLGATIPPGGDRDVAEPTLAAVADAVVENGLIRPANLSRGLAAAPAGHELRITLSVDGRNWTEGPRIPVDQAGVENAARRVSVRLAPGDVRPGRLRVEVWP